MKQGWDARRFTAEGAGPQGFASFQSSVLLYLRPDFNASSLIKRA